MSLERFVTDEKHKAPPPGQWLGQPRGIFLVAGTEFWERFSYYGMVGLLVLFLTSSALQEGFGWSDVDAIKFYGIYSGLIFASPAIGGWLASTYFGERKCILYGGIAVAVGHFLLAGPVVLAALANTIANADVSGLLDAAEPRYGRLFPTSVQWAEIEQRLIANGLGAEELAAMGGWFKAVYAAKSWSFMAGLALIVAGTGFIKSTVSSIVGKLYAENDERRNTGFTIFMVGVWGGSFLSNFVAGTLGEKIGWHYGLGAAGVGMALGVGAYVLFQNALLGDVGKLPDRRLSAAANPGGQTRLTVTERRRIAALVLMSFFTIVFSIAFYQKGGLIHLMVREDTNRMFGGFEVPATWFLTISTGTFIISALIIDRIYVLLAKGGKHIDVVQKQAMGLLSIAIGYVFMQQAASIGAGAEGAVIPMWYFAVGYIFFGIGDVFIWPPQIAAVSQYAPDRYKSFAVGAWMVTTGVGTFLTGYVGALGYEIGAPILFRGLLLLCLSGAVVLLLLRPVIRNLLNETMA